MNTNRIDEYYSRDIPSDATPGCDTDVRISELSHSWEQQVPQAVAKATSALTGAVTMATRIAVLETRLARLEATQSRTILLSALPSDEIVLLKPIPVALTFNGDDYIATFFDAKISTSGDTEQDAFWSLGDLIVAQFLRLAQLDVKILGKGPRRQLLVLQQFLERT